MIGDVLVDVVVAPLNSTRDGSDTPSTITWRQGGAAASTAAHLAGLGCPVRLIGRIGDDLVGRSLTQTLSAAGVECCFAVDPSASTGTLVALIDSARHGGERNMFTSRGASAAIAPEDLGAGWLDGVGHVHLSGYLLLDQGSRDAGLAVLAQAERAGVTLSVDPSSAAPLAAVGPDTFLDWLPAGTLLTPNADEAVLLTGLDNPEQAVRHLADRFGEAIITLGVRGAVWSDGAEVRTVPAAPGPDGSSEAPDPVGAGDAFTAGLLASRMRGQTIDRQLTMATQVASAAVHRR